MRSVAFVLIFGAMRVSAHGHPQEIVVNSQHFPGFDPYNEGSAAKAVTWRPFKHEGNGAYLLPHQWTDASKMSCETNDAPSHSVTVAPGGSVTVQWVGATNELTGKPGVGSTPSMAWVHANGVISDYITSCNGDCVSFNIASAGWTRLSADNLDMSQSISSNLRTTMANKPEKYYPTSGKGLWGMAKFVANGSKRTVKIPNLKAGEYILRQELVALHNPKSSTANSGPQMYIGCVRLKVTEGGSLSLPSGTKSSKLYSPDGALANYNHFTQDPTSYKGDGPAIWKQSNDGSDTSKSGSNTSTAGSQSGTGSSNSNDGEEDNNHHQPAKCKKRSLSVRMSSRSYPRSLSRSHGSRYMARSFTH